MKRLFVMFLVLAAAGTLISDPVAITDTEIKEIAEPIFSSVIQGLEEEDYAKYSRFFTPQLASVLSYNGFGTIVGNHKKYVGKITDLEYIGDLDRKNYTTALFKGESSKQGHEVLMKLDLIKVQVDVSEDVKEDRVFVNGLEFEVLKN